MSERTEIFEKMFETVMPIMFEATSKAFPLEGMEGTNLTIQINLTGEEGVQYGMAIKDAKELTITPGVLDDPLLLLELPSEIIFDLIEKMMSMPAREVVDALHDIKGTVFFKLLGKDGASPFSIKMVYNSATEPSFTMSSDVATLQGIMNGADSPITAFMQGKVKVEGDVPFMMELMNTFAAFLLSPS